MGLSFNLHLCNTDSFEKVKAQILNKIWVNIHDYAIDSFFMEKTYTGFQFVLSKIFPENIIKTLFYGSNNICSIDFKSDYYKNLPCDELSNLYINTPQLSYIDNENINKIYNVFLNNNEDEILTNYDPNELIQNKIYPEYFRDEYIKIRKFLEKSIKNNYIIFVEIV